MNLFLYSSVTFHWERERERQTEREIKIPTGVTWHSPLSPLKCPLKLSCKLSSIPSCINLLYFFYPHFTNLPLPPSGHSHSVAILTPLFFLPLVWILFGFCVPVWKDNTMAFKCTSPIFSDTPTYIFFFPCKLFRSIWDFFFSLCGRSCE